MIIHFVAVAFILSAQEMLCRGRRASEGLKSKESGVSTFVSPVGVLLKITLI